MVPPLPIMYSTSCLLKGVARPSTSPFQPSVSPTHWKPYFSAAYTQPRIAGRRLLQLLHQMLTFQQKAAVLLADFFQMKFLDVFELHDRLFATASATLMPSTPAERMPPA